MGFRNQKRKKEKDSTFELLLVLQRNKSSRSHILLLFLRIIITKNSSKARQNRRQKHLETTITRLSFNFWGRHLVHHKSHPESFSLSISINLLLLFFVSVLSQSVFYSVSGFWIFVEYLL